MANVNLSRSTSLGAPGEKTYLRDGFEPVSNLYVSSNVAKILPIENFKLQSQSTRSSRDSDDQPLQRSNIPLDAHLAELVHTSLYKSQGKAIRKVSPVRRVSLCATDVDAPIASRHRSVPEHKTMNRQDSGFSCSSNGTNTYHTSNTHSIHHSHNTHQSSQRSMLECPPYSPNVNGALTLTTTASVGRGKSPVHNVPSSQSQSQSHTQLQARSNTHSHTHTPKPIKDASITAHPQLPKKKWSLRLPMSWVTSRKGTGTNPRQSLDMGGHNVRALHNTKETKSKKAQRAPNNSSRGGNKQDKTKRANHHTPQTSEYMNTLSHAQQRSQSVSPPLTRSSSKPAAVLTHATTSAQPIRTHVRRHSDPKRPNSSFIASIKKRSSLGLSKHKNGRSVSTPESFLSTVRPGPNLYTELKEHENENLNVDVDVQDYQRTSRNTAPKKQQTYRTASGGVVHISNRHSVGSADRARMRPADVSQLNESEQDVYELHGPVVKSKSADLVAIPIASLPTTSSIDAYEAKLGIVRSITEKEMLAYEPDLGLQHTVDQPYLDLFESLAICRGRARSDPNAQSDEGLRLVNQVREFEDYTKGLVDVCDVEATRPCRCASVLSDGAVSLTSATSAVSGGDNKLAHTEHERGRSVSPFDTQSMSSLPVKRCGRAHDYAVSECDCHLAAEVGQSVHACTEVSGCLEVCTEMTVQIRPRAPADRSTQQHSHPTIAQGQAWSGIHTKAELHKTEPVIERTALCILCEQVMKKRGQALYVAACGHTYHWGCATQRLAAAESSTGSTPPCYVCTSFPFAFVTYAMLELSEGEAVEYLRRDGRDGSFLLRNSDLPDSSRELLISCIQRDVVKHFPVRLTDSGSFAIADTREFLTLDEMMFDLHRKDFVVREAEEAELWRLQQPCHKS